MNRDRLIRIVKKLDQGTYQSRKRASYPALLGYGDGTTLFVESLPTDWVWARIQGINSGAPVKVICISITPLYGIGVKVEKNLEGDWEVTGYNRAHAQGYMEGRPLPSTGRHAATHFWDSTDPLLVDSRSMGNLRVTPTNPVSLAVEVSPGFYIDADGNDAFFGGGTLTLSDSVPIGAHRQRLTIIGIHKATGELVATDGAASVKAFEQPYMPFTGHDAAAIAIDDAIEPLGAVRMYASQTLAQSWDIAFDRRRWLGGVAGTSGVTDHGALTGLEDDDHEQYFNEMRGDARYSLLTHDHDADYAPLVHDHDDLYYTEGEVDTLLAGKADNPHTHVATDITDFDTEVSANSDVAANTAARHDQNTDTALDTGNPNEVTAADLRAHLDDPDIHREINDAGTGTTDLWSADKISDELARTGHVFQARLTLTTDSPVLFANVTGATTIYLSPYKGNAIQFPGGERYTMTGDLSLSLAGIGANRLFDIFCHYNSGTPTLTTELWTAPSTGAITDATNATPIVITSTAHGLSNNMLVTITGIGGNTAANGTFRVKNATANTFELTTKAGANVAGSGAYTSGGTWQRADQSTARSAAISRSNGLWVKSSDTDYLYLGTARTTATAGQTEMYAATTFNEETSLLLWNNYNRVMIKAPLSGSGGHTYSLGPPDYRLWNDTLTSVMSIVVGLPEDAMQISYGGDQEGSGTVAALSVGINEFVPSLQRIFSAGNRDNVSTIQSLLPQGYMRLNMLQDSNGGSCTYYSFTMDATYLG